MSLLSEDRLAHLDRIALQKADRLDASLRTAAWGKQGERTPPSMVRLTNDQDRQVWMDYLRRQSMNEQQGTAPGDTATAVLESPIMQQTGQQ